MDATRRRFVLASTLALASGLRRPAAGADEPAPPPAEVPLTLVAARIGAADAALSYDGTAAGPVVRIRKGTALSVTLTNRLDEPTSLQWHGLRADNMSDGDLPLMGRPLAPGETARWRLVPPDSGLFWFHPAALPGLSDQTGRRLRGVLVVEEPEPPTVDSDLVVSIAGTAPAPTVNGAAVPLTTTIVPGGRLRLRVLNASTTRIMTLGIDGARPKIVAIDGQPSQLFAPVRDAVPIGPGARFEFLLDAPRSEGAAIRLTMQAGVGAAGEGPKPAENVLVAVTTKGDVRPALPPIAPLPANPHLPAAIALEASVRATAVIEAVSAGPARWRITGGAGLDLAPRPLLSVPRGGAVTLGLDNRSSAAVPIRVHGHAMRLLHARDDGWEPYWRDSVILPAASVSHVAFVADNPGKWLIESAMFDQAAFGLRSWFAVT